MTPVRFLSILSLSLILLAASGTAQDARAQTSRIYFAGYMGLNTYGDMPFDEESTPISGDLQSDNAFSFAGAMGLRLDQQWRVEAELSYRKSELATVDYNNFGRFDINGDLSTWLLMANVYYDLDLDWKNLQPFVTAGVGVAMHDIAVDDISGLGVDSSGNDFNFAWQVGTGLKYRVTENMAFSGGYRYLATTPIVAEDYEIDFDSHEIRVGIEYDLPYK